MATVAIIGAGIAGLEAASILAENGLNVFIIEKTDQIGGNINKWYHLFPNDRDAKDIREYLQNISQKTNITILRENEIVDIINNGADYVISTNKKVDIRADAILISSGFEPFNAEIKEEYGYNIYDNVLTSVDLEQIFRENKELLTAQKTIPKRIAFAHCVGSRDAKVGHTYCSKVCCITGVKQAIEVQKRVNNVENYCFYMDLRMFNLEYEDYYKRAQQNHHTQFIRGRISEVSQNIDGSLQLKAEDTLSGLPMKMKVDMLILLVGMVPSTILKFLNQKIGLELEPNGFVKPKDNHLKSNLTNLNGVFVAGTAIGPMTITETIAHARSAALEIIKFLKK